MPDTDTKNVVVYNELVLWHLAPGTRLREIGVHGREFTVDRRRPGKLWLGAVPCTLDDIEMPVEVMGR